MIKFINELPSGTGSETDIIVRSPANPPVKASKPTLLFALSAGDRDRFFPSPPAEAEFGAKVRWVDVSKISAKEWESLLVEIAPEVLVTAWETPAIPASFAGQPDLPLRYVCHLAGGIHGVVPRLLLERGVLVSNWGDLIGHAVAEHALLLTLAALRNLPLWNSFMGMPTNRIVEMRTRSLLGKRVGIHGFGVIAREIARMLQPFHVDLSAYSAGVPRELFERHEVKPCASLEKLFLDCEVLIECELLNQTSRQSVTGALLDLLAPDAAFINVGRGAVVDEEALLQRAAQGKIRVALDVYGEEPPAPDSSFFKLPNVLLSPHIAGPTADSLLLCGEFAVSNLRRYMKGQPVEGPVSLAAYDRAL